MLIWNQEANYMEMLLGMLQGAEGLINYMEMLFGMPLPVNPSPDVGISNV